MHVVNYFYYQSVDVETRMRWEVLRVEIVPVKDTNEGLEMVIDESCGRDLLRGP